jgi:hypothetical protein
MPAATASARDEYVGGCLYSLFIINIRNFLRYTHAPHSLSSLSLKRASARLLGVFGLPLPSLKPGDMFSLTVRQIVTRF